MQNHCLLLHATSGGDGEALVVHGGSQRGGADDVEVLARPDALSQPYSDGVRK